MLPRTPGIGLKSAHYVQVLDGGHGLEWFEVHPENYMSAGGLPHRYLSAVRQEYGLSMHGVGMSLGSVGGIDGQHLTRLKRLVDQYQPNQVSEHIAWSHGQQIFHNDLLPMPYNAQSLDVLDSNIDQVQTALGRQILVENPSTYLCFDISDMTEPEFLSEVHRRTGCGLLLDVNNVHVSAVNNGFDARAYIDACPLHAVGEIHLAGHSVEHIGETRLLIDDHGSPVADEVWELCGYVMENLPEPVPVLIEWDTDVPPFGVMLAEVARAAELLQPRVT